MRRAIWLWLLRVRLGRAQRSVDNLREAQWIVDRALSNAEVRLCEARSQVWCEEIVKTVKPRWSVTSVFSRKR